MSPSRLVLFTLICCLLAELALSDKKKDKKDKKTTSTAAPKSTAAKSSKSKACKCPRRLEPVCGKDGKDYTHPCYAECEGMKVKCEGKCAECDKKDKKKDKDSKDDKFWGPPSSEEEEPEKKDKKKKEKKRCKCPRSFKPVCGKDGNDYNHPCMAKCEGTTVRCQGICEECE